MQLFFYNHLQLKTPIPKVLIISHKPKLITYKTLTRFSVSKPIIPINHFSKPKPHTNKLSLPPRTKETYSPHPPRDTPQPAIHPPFITFIAPVYSLLFSAPPRKTPAPTSNHPPQKISDRKAEKTWRIPVDTCYYSTDMQLYPISSPSLPFPTLLYHHLHLSPSHLARFPLPIYPQVTIHAKTPSVQTSCIHPHPHPIPSHPISSPRTPETIPCPTINTSVRSTDLQGPISSLHRLIATRRKKKRNLGNSPNPSRLQSISAARACPRDALAVLQRHAEAWSLVARGGAAVRDVPEDFLAYPIPSRFLFDMEYSDDIDLI